MGSGTIDGQGQAVDALPDTGGAIAVKPGVYREVVTIRKPHVHLYGTSADPAKTEIVFNHTGPKNGGTFNSATVFVEADHVTIDHLTIANDAGSGKGQAVALAVTADRAIFRHLRIIGAQDTLFAASKYCYGDYGPCVPGAAVLQRLLYRRKCRFHFSGIARQCSNVASCMELPGKTSCTRRRIGIIQCSRAAMSSITAA